MVFRYDFPVLLAGFGFEAYDFFEKLRTYFAICFSAREKIVGYRLGSLNARSCVGIFLSKQKNKSRKFPSSE
jgi:hypothetical protein